MRAVGLEVLKNKLSEYVRLAQGGETVLVTDRERVVAELRPPGGGRADSVSDARLAELVRSGPLRPALRPPGRVPAALSIAPTAEILAELERDQRRPMIYLDTPVALAQPLGEDRRPPARLWDEPLFSSRLLEYELWSRAHARKLSTRQHEEVAALVEQVSLVELSPTVLERALHPFPSPVRTLAAIHLATVDFLHRNGRPVRLPSYDDRMNAAASRMKLKLFAG